ncbi:MAG: DinB family protein [Longimicrobiales bacterium]
MISGPTAQVADGSIGDAYIGSLVEQLDAILRDARNVTDGLTAAQLNWKPDARRWSVGQCLDHLTRTARLYPTEIERMISEARARGGKDGPFRESWISRWVLSGMEPPPRMRIRTMRSVEPTTDLDPDRVVREFEGAYVRLRELMIASDGVALKHARMRSPFVPVLRFTLGQVLALNLAHARRHLWQARQVRQCADFPL